MSIINKKNNVSGNWSHKLGKKYNIAMGKTKSLLPKNKLNMVHNFKNTLDQQ